MKSFHFISNVLGDSLHCANLQFCDIVGCDIPSNSCNTYSLENVKTV